MPGKVVFCTIAVAAMAAVLAPAARSATLVADYQFQRTHASSVAGAPAISDIGPGNTFATETVGCTPTQVLSFPKGSGLQVNPSSTVFQYSIVVLFRLADVSGYRRIFVPDDPSFATENGLYDFSGRLASWENGLKALGPTVVFANNTYAEVAFTYWGGPGQRTTGYVNAVQQFGYDSSPALDAENMRFFKDNDGAGSTSMEDSAGAVARISIYSGLLTADEILAIHDSGPLAGACNPANHATAAVNGKVKVKKGRNGRFVVLTGIDAGCPVGLGTCTGTAVVQRTTGPKRLASVSKLPKRLGKKKLSVAAGKTQAVKVKLTRKASEALRDKGKLKAKISVNLSPPGGTAAVASRIAKLKPPR